MSLFSLLFPREAARLARAERAASRAVALLGYDELLDPSLAAVVAEVRAGRETKAAELYAGAVGCSAAEARLAVQALAARTPTPGPAGT